MPKHNHKEPTIEELVTPELYEDSKWLLDICGKQGWKVDRMLRAFVGVEVMVEAAMKQSRNGRHVRASKRVSE